MVKNCVAKRSTTKKVKHAPVGTPLVQAGGGRGDIVYTADGTKIQIATGGGIPGSSLCCKRWSLHPLEGVVYDTAHPLLGVGQECSCTNPWSKKCSSCPHTTRTLIRFLQIGSKIRKVCSERGTDAEELLRAEPWSWYSALDHIRGEGTIKPPWMQLRRTLFFVLPLNTSREPLPQPKEIISLPNFEYDPSDSIAIPGLPLSVQLQTYKGELSTPLELVLLHAYPLGYTQEMSAEVAAMWKKIEKMDAPLQKSMLQKLIRWGQSIQVGEEGDHGDILVRCAFLALAFGNGQFTPEIGDHSTGQRLAFHRMAIILIEDGIDPQDIETIPYWAALAGTQQINPTPLPSCILLKAMDVLVRARNSDN